MPTTSERRSLSGFEVDERISAESAANTAQTVSTTTGPIRRLLMVTVKYSSAVTQNVTITLNAGAGASWDTLLQTIALAAATDGTWTPNDDIYILKDDVIDVLAPAGGGGITSAVSIYTGVF